MSPDIRREDERRRQDIDYDARRRAYTMETDVRIKPSYKGGAVAGLTGAVVMSAVGLLLSLVGIPAQPTAMVVGLLGLGVGVGGWILGFAIHLALGALFGVAYAWIFERVTRTAGVGTGALIGFIHGIAAVVFASAMGPIASLGVLGLLLIHATFGAVAGGYYRRFMPPVSIG